MILDLGNGVTMDLVEIPAGTFIMGSPIGEGDDDEDPEHSVTISKKFYMGKYEVTQDQWVALMGSNPSEYKISGNHPVEEVSWNDSQNFCNVLAAWIGRVARLPTEAEWEYACRAGSTTRYYFGDDFGIPPMLGDYAWYASNTGWETEEVGQLLPNDFGLYDMHGNVWEWCLDWHDDDYYSVSSVTDPLGPDTGSYKVMRSGGWLSFAPVCRSANRGWFGPSSRADDVGLRVVVEGQEPITLSLDIKPGGCPNPLNKNTKGKGKLPVAILGTDLLDVNEIVTESISIAGTVFPVRTPKIEDVATPLLDGEECECHKLEGDGYDDLVIHFFRRDIILELGLNTMERKTVVPITIEGTLLDGTPFTATDCVKLVGRKD
jgi:hypothetical protein